MYAVTKQELLSTNDRFSKFKSIASKLNLAKAIK